MPTRPFALNADQLITKIEDEVVPLNGVGMPHADPQVGRVTSDRQFRNYTLLVGRQHATDASRSIGWAVS